jgi:GT2 family glycosyltransferase
MESGACAQAVTFTAPFLRHGSRCMNASVVIPSRGRSAALARTLEPLREDPALLEIVVVADDDPAVGPAVAALGEPRVRVVDVCVHHQNAARQAGLEAARGDVVLFLDDDVIAQRGTVSGHVAHHGVPGRVVVGYMPVPRARLKGVSRFPARAYARSYETQTTTWDEDPSRILTTLWGGNLSMRRTDALRVGIFNPDFTGRYFEDWEFGRRCHAAGMVGVFDRRLRGRHGYRRGVLAWLREGRVQGAAHVQLGVDWARHPLDFLARPAVAALVGALFVCGALRLHALEWRIAYRVRRLQMRLGAREARRLEVGRPSLSASSRTTGSDSDVGMAVPSLLAESLGNVLRDRATVHEPVELAATTASAAPDPRA